MKKLLKKRPATPVVEGEEAPKKKLIKSTPTAPKVAPAKKPPVKKAPKTEPEEIASEELFPTVLESGGKTFCKTNLKFKALKKFFEEPHSGYPFRVLLDETGDGDVVEFAIVAAITSVHMVDISTEDGYEDRFLLSAKEFDKRMYKEEAGVEGGNEFEFVVYLEEYADK